MRANKEASRAEAEVERARSADQLRSDTEKTTDALKDALKLAQKTVSKLEAELAEMKAAKETTNSEASKLCEAGKIA